MQIGDTHVIHSTVTAENTAVNIGSGGMPVYGTPYMAALMENAAYTMLQRELPEGKTSVGTMLSVFHVSASPVGIGVHAAAEITDISPDGRSVGFKVFAYDDAGQIGEGTHRRAIVDAERFLAKCEGKLKKED